MSKFEKLDGYKPFDKLGVHTMYLKEVNLDDEKFYDFIFSNKDGMLNKRVYFSKDNKPYDERFMAQLDKAIEKGEGIAEKLEYAEGNKKVSFTVFGAMECYIPKGKTELANFVGIGFVGVGNMKDAEIDIVDEKLKKKYKADFDKYNAEINQQKPSIPTIEDDSDDDGNLPY